MLLKTSYVTCLLFINFLIQSSTCALPNNIQNLELDDITSLWDKFPAIIDKIKEAGMLFWYDKREKSFDEGHRCGMKGVFYWWFKIVSWDKVFIFIFCSIKLHHSLIVQTMLMKIFCITEDQITWYRRDSSLEHVKDDIEYRPMNDSCLVHDDIIGILSRLMNILTASFSSMFKQGFSKWNRDFIAFTCFS